MMRRTMFQFLAWRNGSFGPAPIRRLALGLAGAVTLALPWAAQAQQPPAYTNGPTIMRAGPSQEYPEVARVQPGVPVRVMGCLQNYSWCDVGLQGARGWVHAGRLSYPYQGGSVPLSNYGMTLGIPIVSFAIGPYWDEFYRGRPWFHDQDRWAHRGPPPFDGGPGPGWGGPPRHGDGPDRGGFRGGPGGAGEQPFHGGGPGGEGFHGGPGGERPHDGGQRGPGGDGHHGGDDHGHGGPGQG